ncbi:hypothetical protein SARC_01585 [Sphaeroforma arctica JP610]|uniref:Trimeric autotransporter adhesin YadA-like head domain-containing protein n=1 Tax=Sphaeroforma arctica JP610 TaxID=667725 RepID=A0A0L0GDD6_9EUKA|nr:hypothetical protein SARC_01585 [Sphaeroforma arctica JP610]KNC86263.1 hypothetical protein SARC_01585 [Sphaeroforma arctica JP610]|eukprot:XP_014160165.1 hypothetical protein SARC_01585 [Sphaeroforma arctica JP610]
MFVLSIYKHTIVDARLDRAEKTSTLSKLELTEPSSVSVGTQNGVQDTRGRNSISIGQKAGKTSQGHDTIAIGFGAGHRAQGDNSIAVGKFAGPNA